MSVVVGAVGGFRGVRAELLVALKKGQPLTAPELGAMFGLTANALRRHLKALEEDGLVQHVPEARGVGAPVHVYRLTPSADTLFPREYVSVLATALDALREAQGAAAVTAVLEAEWDRLADEAAPIMADLPLAERVALAAELLSAKGYMAEAVPAGVEEAIHAASAAPDAPPAAAAPRAPGEPVAVLRIHNCALGEIAERFPDACAVEARTLERLLGVPLARAAHRHTGCGHCEYGITQELLVNRSASGPRPPAAQNAAPLAGLPTRTGGRALHVHARMPGAA